MPLTKLQSLEELNSEGIPNTTSLLPLDGCLLKRLECSGDALDNDELIEKMPRPQIQEEEDWEDEADDDL